MLEGLYRRRLAADLPNWRERGWVTAEGAAAILASLESGRSAIGLSAVVAVLGAVLFGLGVVAFVGANWEDMPRLVRFILLILAMALAYLIAGALAKRAMPALADAAVLFAGLVFAAAIALVGQTYHLAGDFADAVLLWIIGALGAAALTRSVSATVMALAGACYWTSIVSGAPDAVWYRSEAMPHWAGLAPILAGGAIALALDSRFARLAFVAALAYWIGLAVYVSLFAFDWSAGGAFALAATAALAFWALGSFLATGIAGPRLALLGYDFLWPSIAVFLAMLWGLQIAAYFGETAGRGGWIGTSIALVIVATLLAFAASLRGDPRIVHAAAVPALGAATLAFAVWHGEDAVLPRLAIAAIILAAALWAVGLGQTGREHVGKKTGLVAFGAEIFYAYVVTFGTLMDTAVAFLLGGLLFIGLSVLLLRVDRWLRRPSPPAGTEATP
jgi:uncharacterized membrane protein